jgi:hypothetical protein
VNGAQFELALFDKTLDGSACERGPLSPTELSLSSGHARKVLDRFEPVTP